MIKYRKQLIFNRNRNKLSWNCSRKTTCSHSTRLSWPLSMCNPHRHFVRNCILNFSLKKWITEITTFSIENYKQGFHIHNYYFDKYCFIPKISASQTTGVVVGFWSSGIQQNLLHRCMCVWLRGRILFPNVRNRYKTSSGIQC